MVFLHTQQLPGLGRGDRMGSSYRGVTGKRSAGLGLLQAFVSYLGVPACKLSSTRIGLTRDFSSAYVFPCNSPDLFPQSRNLHLCPKHLKPEEGVASNGRISVGFELSFSCPRGSFFLLARDMFVRVKDPPWKPFLLRVLGRKSTSEQVRLCYLSPRGGASLP